MIRPLPRTPRTTPIVLLVLSGLLAAHGTAGADRPAQESANKRAKDDAVNNDMVQLTPSGPLALPKDLPKKAHFVVVKLREEVGLGMASFVERVAKGLRKDDILLLDVNTFGGRIDAAVVIRDALLHLKDRGARAVTYVNPRAISAGALISYATDVIVVAPGATMGAATPIQISGGKAKSVGEKVVSYMRKEMRATAEARGRNGDIAEAMVDADVAIKGLIAKGKLLTLDGKAMLKWGVASLAADSRDALIRRLGYDGSGGRTYTVQEVGWSWAEKLAGWLSSSMVSGLLMTIGMLGLLIGLYAGGSPVPLAVGGTCLILFFAGHYVTDLVGIEDLVLFGLGTILLTIELLTPGFFIPGIAGILCIIASLFLGLIDFDKVPLTVQWQTGWIMAALSAVFGAILATGVLAVLALRWLPTSRLGRPLILTARVTARAHPPVTQAEGPGSSLVGSIGTAVSDLRPAGKVRVGERRIDAIAELGYIEAGTEVKIVRQRGFQVSVMPVQQRPS